MTQPGQGSSGSSSRLPPPKVSDADATDPSLALGMEFPAVQLPWNDSRMAYEWCATDLANRKGVMVEERDGVRDGVRD